MDEPVPEPAESGWSLPRRLSFRFAFAFFALYAFVGWHFPHQPIEMLVSESLRRLDEAVAAPPIHRAREAVDRAIEWMEGENALGAFYDAWPQAVEWFGREVLRLEEPARPVPNTGSGDTLFDYVQLAAVATLALALALLSTLLLRRWRAHPRLAEWLWIGARFFLAATMIGYGFAKVVKVQFSEPHLGALAQPFGEMSPMGLLWRFMGFSTAYTVFSGIGEVLGSILLCFRRTATLGALVVFGVMINVAMLNFSYDVPVKLYASYYLLLSALIAVPDARRLGNVLVLNRPAPARDLRGPFRAAALNHAVTAAAFLWLGLVSWGLIERNLDRYRLRGDGRARSPIAGSYEVESFALAGVELPALPGESRRWKRFAIDVPEFLSLVTMDGARKGYRLTYDARAGTLELTEPGPAAPATASAPASAPAPAVLALRELEPALYELTGDLFGEPLALRARRRTAEEFLLLNRGFHWISPYPFNR